MKFRNARKKYKKKQLILWGMTLSISFIMLAIVWNSISNNYAAEIESFRKNKNEKFKQSSESPIEDQVGFNGLRYFDPNPEYKIRPQLILLSDSTQVTIVNNDGERNNYRRFALAIFTIKNITDTLTIFQKVLPKGKDQFFFIPFFDETNGDETYSGGRYLEFAKAPVPNEFVLDFNLAYNPYCVYNYRFSCPLPPRENRLALRIEAGERMFLK
ncbi:MAG: DUF1684 domain-containing protein [Cytophagaceae bacterium]|jgi:hypothetical protein|nr:DUF1684 domain-containing protein [Cytophagaceae bacterium]